MKHFVVTIARSAGCGGKEIGKRLAELLDVEYYDRALVETVAEATGISHYDISHMEEIFADTLTPNSVDISLCDSVIAAQTSAIRTYAEQSSCVLVGRCADYILKDRTDCLNVYLYAPLKPRARSFMKAYGLDRYTAESMVHHIDAKRDHYYSYVTGKDRDDASLKHIMLDTSLFGIEGTAKLLKDIVETRFSDHSHQA